MCNSNIYISLKDSLRCRKRRTRRHSKQKHMNKKISLKHNTTCQEKKGISLNHMEYAACCFSSQIHLNSFSLNLHLVRAGMYFVFWIGLDAEMSFKFSLQIDIQFPFSFFILTFFFIAMWYSLNPLKHHVHVQNKRMKKKI